MGKVPPTKEQIEAMQKIRRANETTDQVGDDNVFCYRALAARDHWKRRAMMYRTAWIIQFIAFLLMTILYTREILLGVGGV